MGDQKAGAELPVWVAMVGVNPGIANQAVYGDTKGAYFWVAAAAQNQDHFRWLVKTELSRRGLSLAEVSDVMLAEDARTNRLNADIDWQSMITGAMTTRGLFIGSHFFIYEQGSE